MLSAHKDFEIGARAGNASEALDALKSVRVDIVLLDVEMPGTSGLQALPEILKRGHGARVLIVSSICEQGAEATVKALALGAADTLPSPAPGGSPGAFWGVRADRCARTAGADRPKSAGPPPLLQEQVKVRFARVPIRLFPFRGSGRRGVRK